MPDFYIDDLYVTPGDFVEACSSREIEQLIDILKEDGYLNNSEIGDVTSIHDEIFIDAIKKIAVSRHMLTKEDEELIIAIYKKL